MSKFFRFVSTRGKSSTSNFRDVIQTGYCEDGGIYLPETLPFLDKEKLQSWSQHSFSEICFEILKLFCADCKEDGIPHDVLREICESAHSGFGHKDIIPVIPLEDNISIAEMYHGMTHAFKDLALQVVGRLLEYCVAQKPEKKFSNCAICTTGDTGNDRLKLCRLSILKKKKFFPGPAAIAALRQRKGINMVVFYPLYPAISRVQELQMISVKDENIKIIGTKIDADSNDEVIKNVFIDAKAREEYQLSTINSINFARIAIAIAHYFFCYLRVEPACENDVVFSVPSGSFGNSTAALIARKMGCPAKKIIFCNNHNDPTYRLVTSGKFSLKSCVSTVAPAIDCVNPYNLERVLYYCFDDKHLMLELMAKGDFELPETAHQRLREIFDPHVCQDEEILAIMKDVWSKHRYLVDPHTACAVYAARKSEFKRERIICLSTAHPYKFKDVVKKATSVDPFIPFGLKFMRGMDLEHVDYSKFNVEKCEGTIAQVEQVFRRILKETN